MQLSDATLRTLDGWIGPETWSSNHHLDEQRFFRFIHQLSQDDGFDGNIEGLIDFIKARKAQKDKPLNDYLQKELRKRIVSAEPIIEYQRYINSLG